MAINLINLSFKATHTLGKYHFRARTLAHQECIVNEFGSLERADAGADKYGLRFYASGYDDWGKPVFCPFCDRALSEGEDLFIYCDPQ